MCEVVLKQDVGNGVSSLGLGRTTVPPGWRDEAGIAMQLPDLFGPELRRASEQARKTTHPGVVQKSQVQIIKMAKQQHHEFTPSG